MLYERGFVISASPTPGYPFLTLPRSLGLTRIILLLMSRALLPRPSEMVRLMKQ
ncbi:putative 26S proteasome non-ATPase regulatory subunit 3 [Iris pallida]|uniref:26S proteasome non-ATPase regulatory subunit 3 n=1 Tax=Iris pallida TaxID=29817 RepID=A0AAX6G388_IRIPA|nr:putative 26S proteasome non-ATPase regulatory subunit 3 [Iris pallida]